LKRNQVDHAHRFAHTPAGEIGELRIVLIARPAGVGQTGQIGFKKRFDSREFKMELLKPNSRPGRTQAIFPQKFHKLLSACP
jgi:hypothetical protein